MTRYPVNGIRYHVTEAGAGEPVVLLHGFTGSAANWHQLMALLSDRYRVIGVDLPGHGSTDAPADLSGYAMPRVAGDLAELIARLGATPAHWLGYSMGGRLALYMAIHYPALVRSLILESASPGLDDARQQAARRAQDEALAERIEAGGIPAFVDYWEDLPLFATQEKLPPEARAALREQRLANSARGLADSLRGMGTGVQPSLWGQLSSLKPPVLLMAGELDEKFTAINRHVAERVQGARLEIIPNAGHTIHLEQTAIFTRIVLEFLARSSEISGHDLAHAEQDDENESRQRHLFEPRVESR